MDTWNETATIFFKKFSVFLTVYCNLYLSMMKFNTISRRMWLSETWSWLPYYLKFQFMSHRYINLFHYKTWVEIIIVRMKFTITLSRQNAELLKLKWVAHIFNTVNVLEVTTGQLYDLTTYGLRTLAILFCLMLHYFKNSIVLSNCLFFWQEQKVNEDEYRTFVQWKWQDKGKVLRKIHVPLSLSLKIAHACICWGLWIFKFPLKSEPLEN